MHSYDWRLAYYNLEVRDRYFSRLKSAIEFNLQINEKKTVLISHSMGSTVLLVCFRFPAYPTLADWKLTDHTLASQWFFKWVESPVYGKGGDDWVDKHVSDWINVAGTLLGVPKAMSALVSGEMRGGCFPFPLSSFSAKLAAFLDSNRYCRSQYRWSLLVGEVLLEV